MIKISKAQSCWELSVNFYSVSNCRHHHLESIIRKASFWYNEKIRDENCKKYTLLHFIAKALECGCVQTCYFSPISEVLFAIQNIKTGSNSRRIKFRVRLFCIYGQQYWSCLMNILLQLSAGRNKNISHHWGNWSGCTNRSDILIWSYKRLLKVTQNDV